MNVGSKKKQDGPRQLSDWYDRFDDLNTKAESVLDLEYLDSLIDEPIKDEFVMIPYEDPAPKPSYQIEFVN